MSSLDRLTWPCYSGAIIHAAYFSHVVLFLASKYKSRLQKSLVSF